MEVNPIKVNFFGKKSISTALNQRNVKKNMIRAMKLRITADQKYE